LCCDFAAKLEANLYKQFAVKGSAVSHLLSVIKSRERRFWRSALLLLLPLRICRQEREEVIWKCAYIVSRTQAM